MPVWATVVISVLCALLVFVAGVSAYLVFFHQPELDSTLHDIGLLYDDNFYIWRQQYLNKSYHWSAVLMPGRTHSGIVSDGLLTNPQTPDEVTPTVRPSADVPTRNEKRVNFLVMGHDKVALNTDVVMLVNFDMETGGVNILQIPRDTFFKTGRINTLMATERAKARNADPSLKNDALLKKGMEGAVLELEKSLGIRIDGYAIINIEGFRNVIDVIGGVYMDVPYAMHYEDPEQNLFIHLNPGPQTLNGAQSEMFVRYRYGYVQGDIGRVNAQKMFLTALFKELTSVTVSEAAGLAEQAFKYVTTDIGLADIVFYAKEALGIDLGKVTMMTLPGKDTTSSSGASYYVMNRAATLPIISEYFNVFDNYEITDSVFDKSRSFTANDRRFSRIYDSTEIEADIKTADGIDRDSLDVPLIK